MAYNIRRAGKTSLGYFLTASLIYAGVSSVAVAQQTLLYKIEIRCSGKKNKYYTARHLISRIKRRRELHRRVIEVTQSRCNAPVKD